MPVKVSGCGSLVKLDFTGGGTFTTIALVDSITYWNRSKSINDTPTLDCGEDNAEIGNVEQSTLTFALYRDHQDADHEAILTNFDESISDNSKKDIACQIYVPDYSNDGGTTSNNVTYEADCQIASIEPEDVTPDGYWKETVTLLRKGAITKTVTATI